VIDCGDGVARQLVSAGILLPTLRHVFIAHQHSDHNADYGNLVLLAWTAPGPGVIASRPAARGPCTFSTGRSS
jgi:ribonuclease BN (tRNA processing enzyme)